MKSVKKMRLGTKILIGMALGAVVGAIFGEHAMMFKPLGDLFIKIVKIVVIPLVLASITNGVLAAADMKSFGRIGLKTLVYFFSTTAVAVCLGLLVAQIIQPGTGFTLSVDTSSFTAPKPSGPADMIMGLVPTNPFGAMADGKILQVIIFSILLGIAILMTGEKGKPFARFIESFAEVMLKFVDMIIRTAPYGVFCLIAPTTGKYGLSVLIPLGSVIISLAIAVLLHICIVYFGILKFVARYPIGLFLKNAQEAMLMAFSAALSSAAFPFSIKAQEKMKVSKKVRNFVIPLGMTVNMDGTSLYLAISATFIANVYGIHLTGAQLAMIVLTGVLASIGATTVPMSGFIMLTMVLQAAGLPLEGLALVGGIDRILDMIRTTANVTGDNVGCVTVASLEGEIGVEEPPDAYEPAADAGVSGATAATRPARS